MFHFPHSVPESYLGSVITIAGLAGSGSAVPPVSTTRGRNKKTLKLKRLGLVGAIVYHSFYPCKAPIQK